MSIIGSRYVDPCFPNMAVHACLARNAAEQILQLGFIKKHIHNFLADIVSRESHKIGEGTMVLKAAAVNMLADAEVRGKRLTVFSYSACFFQLLPRPLNGCETEPSCHILFSPSLSRSSGRYLRPVSRNPGEMLVKCLYFSPALDPPPQLRVCGPYCL